MSLQNTIENAHRALGANFNNEHIDIYKTFQNQELQEVFSTIHNMFMVNYELMNSRLPTYQEPAHFWAENSRNLLSAIEILQDLQEELENSPHAFKIDP